MHLNAHLVVSAIARCQRENRRKRFKYIPAGYARVNVLKCAANLLIIRRKSQRELIKAQFENKLLIKLIGAGGMLLPAAASAAAALSARINNLEMRRRRPEIELAP